VDAHADNKSQYESKYYDNAIFALTNGYKFTLDNGNDPDSFIKIGRRGRHGVIQYKRNAEGKTTEHRQSTNDFVAAFPFFGVGAYNGRECSFLPSVPVLPGGEKLRQYDFPAHDLVEVAKRCGLPSRLEDLKELKVSTIAKGDFYGANLFMDLYLQDDEAEGHTAGYKGTLNAINGNFTKHINVNVWFVHPENVNVPGALANGWTGAEKIGETFINATWYEVGVKIERVNGNEFLYVCLVPKSNKRVECDVNTIMHWIRGEGYDLVRASPHAMRQIQTMKKPPHRPTERSILCSLVLGAEIWFQNPQLEYNEIVLQDLKFTVNGKSFMLDGSVIEGEVVKEESPPLPPSSPPVENDKPEAQTEWLPDVTLRDRKHKFDFSGEVVHAGNNGDIVRVRKNKPNLVIVPTGRKGETVLTISNGYKVKVISE